MYLRLAFSVAVHTDPEVFSSMKFWRSATNLSNASASPRSRSWRKGKTLVVVSHDLDLVSRICERGVLLEHGEIVMDGEVHEVVTELRRRAAPAEAP